MKKTITFFPIVLFVILIIITKIPHGFSIMSEPYHPWYTPYTSVVFIFCSFFFYPVTVIFRVMGGSVLELAYMIASLFYAIGVSYMINKAIKYYTCSYKQKTEINNL